MAKLYQHRMDGTYYTKKYEGGIVTRQIHPDGVLYLKNQGVRLGGEIPTYAMSQLVDRKWLYTKEEVAGWGEVDWSPDWNKIGKPQLNSHMEWLQRQKERQRREKAEALALATKRAEDEERQRREAEQVRLDAEQKRAEKNRRARERRIEKKRAAEEAERFAEEQAREVVRQEKNRRARERRAERKRLLEEMQHVAQDAEAIEQQATPSVPGYFPEKHEGEAPIVTDACVPLQTMHRAGDEDHPKIGDTVTGSQPFSAAPPSTEIEPARAVWQLPAWLIVVLGVLLIIVISGLIGKR